MANFNTFNRWWRDLWGHRHLEPTLQPLICLIVPAYDNLTHLFHSWLVGHWSLHVSTRVTLATKANASYDELRKWLSKSAAESHYRLVIFCGHGTPDALLTAPNLGFGNVSVKGVEHGMLVNPFVPPESRDALSWFCFCCYSAHFLGKLLGTYPNSRFLGYHAPISFELAHGGRRFWRKLLSEAVAELVNGHDLDKLRRRLIAEYDSAIAYYKSGSGRSNPRQFFMVLSLVRHRTALSMHSWR